MDYKINIAGLERDLPLCRVSDDFYIAAFILFGDVEMTVTAAEALLAKAPEFDVILTAESKGIPLAFEMARQSGNKPYVVARKGKKLYMKDVFTVTVNSITTDHLQQLCIGEDERHTMAGKRILLVDDVISTGESLESLEKLCDAVGAEIVGRMAILAEGDAIGRGDITYLEPLPVFHADGTIIEE